MESGYNQVISFNLSENTLSCIRKIDFNRKLIFYLCSILVPALFNNINLNTVNTTCVKGAVYNYNAW
jgi:hypothetical protein